MNPKESYAIAQIVLFFLFLTLGIVRFFYFNPSVVFVVSVSSFLISVIMVLIAAAHEIHSLKIIHRLKKESISYRLTIIAIMISLIGFVTLTLLVSLNRIFPTAGDALSIIGFGISISTNFLKRVVIFLLVQGSIPAENSLKKPS
ncbi:hypothetical protein V2B35_14725 [Bacillus safensis]|uniref:hypothetical protein n=1 Tax=Bacillus TaxID=1386 RepID=UPI000F7A864A|nr:MULTISPECIES: hypothetical protein [Bacillus]MCM3368615.1 hypothetical protein [Bacillus safensis]MDJ0291934.1 hypothetical protein [Bacillus safensis]NMW03431.1 hypothetical protein [Bacillus safensis]